MKEIINSEKVFYLLNYDLGTHCIFNELQEIYLPTEFDNFGNFLNNEGFISIRCSEGVRSKI